MQIPDCYEAYRQEEARQRSWDIYLSKLPTCLICGEKIHSGQEQYEAHGKCVCAYCLDELTENSSIVEVD